MLTDAAGPIKHAVVAKATADSTAIVALVTSRSIRILAFNLITAGDAVATLEDEDGVDLIGPLTLPAYGGIVLPFNGGGWNQTASGKALHLLLDAAVQVGGSITYQEIQV